MKDEIIQRLTIVVDALNTIPVSGKQNLANLSGSISVVEETIGMLRGADIVDAAKNTADS